MIDAIQQLWAYNFWAGARFYEAAAALSDSEFVRDLGEGTGSLRDKLGHIYGADEVWLRRIQGVPAPGMPAVAGIGSAAELRKLHQIILENYEQLITGAGEFSLASSGNRVVRYKNLKGVEYETPIFEILLHVANHAMYHRGQAASLLRRLTGTPPVTDLIEFFRAGGSSGGAARP